MTKNASKTPKPDLRPTGGFGDLIQHKQDEEEDKEMDIVIEMSDEHPDYKHSLAASYRGQQSMIDVLSKKYGLSPCPNQKFGLTPTNRLQFGKSPAHVN